MDNNKRLRDASSPDSIYNPPRYVPQSPVPASNRSNERLLLESVKNFSRLEPDKTYYLLAKDWVSLWEDFLNSPVALQPHSALTCPKISNSSLLEFLNNGSEVDDDTFYTVDEVTWDKLVLWYGIVGSDHIISRDAVFKQEEQGSFTGSIKVFQGSVEEGNSFDVECQDLETAQNLIESICYVLEIKDHPSHKVYLVSEDGSSKVFMERHFGLSYMSDKSFLGVYFEAHKEKGKQVELLPAPPKPFLLENGSANPVGYSKKPIGAVGLTNLGNTCFMNSALQCLSNTIPLTSYFLGEDWKNELNPDNPMGMNGKVAAEYANLIAELWNHSPDRSTSFAPRSFKYTIGQFNSTFSGYFQQDSQELLGFLLDGLHEDLNRIKKKPYNEIPDMDDQPDEVIANKIWELYKLRNDSVIVDYFQGEYRSKVQCRTCGKCAVTFDPYMFLTLPIPQNQLVSVSFNILPLADLQKSQQELKSFKLGLRLPKDSSIKELREKAIEAMGWKTSCIVVEVFSAKVYKVFLDYEPISGINPKDEVYIVQTQEADYDYFMGDPEQGSVHLPIYFHHSAAIYFGVPLILTLPKKSRVSSQKEAQLVKDRIYKEVIKTLRRFTKIDLIKKREQSEMIDEDEWEYIQNLFSLKIVKEGKGGYMAYRAPSSECYLIERTKAAEQTPASEVDAMSISSKTVDETDAVMQEAESFENIFDFSAVNFVLEFDADVCLGLFEVDMNKPYSSYDVPACFAVVSSDSFKQWVENERLTRLQEQDKVISFHDCLNEFTKEEALSDNDTFYCKGCKAHQTIKKKIDIWTVPEILVFSLKRFSNSGRSSFRSLGGKIDALIEFPLEGLDLTNFVIGPERKKSGNDTGKYLYDLFGVSNHIGGIGGGHYTAYAKNPLENQWFLFDDSRVSRAQPSDIVSREAYLLFYQRRKERNENHLSEIIEVRKQRKEQIPDIPPSFEPNILPPSPSQNSIDTLPENTTIYSSLDTFSNRVGFEFGQQDEVDDIFAPQTP